MNAQKQLNLSVLNSININSNPEMPGLENLATALGDKNRESAKVLEDDYEAILWDNVYTGR